MKQDAHNSKTQRADNGAPSAFTLVEMLVAVGAVALVSVGLAAIFQTVGKTVTTGKRISALTQQAAILESQMREDFKHMTRDGFLVIRHQFTIGASLTNPRPIPVLRYAGEPAINARPRRIDELLFFATGEYRTAREDLIPGRTATSRAARIYYGHGQKSVVETPQTEAGGYVHYFSPWFSDRFQANVNGQPDPERLGEGATGVNRYACTWNLLRQATLLVRPSTPAGGGWPLDRPVPNYPGDQFAAKGVALANLSTDSSFQVAGQPAAASVFRTHNEMLPMVDQKYGKADAVAHFAMFWDMDQSSGHGITTGIAPRFVSGVVDIASTDLDEIAMVVNGSYYPPGVAFPNGGADVFSPRTINQIGVLEPAMPLMNGPWMATVLNKPKPAFFSSLFVVPTKGNDAKNSYNTTTAIMQGWMLNAMPAASGWHPTIAQQDLALNQQGSDGLQNRLGYRIRCEDDLPDVRGTLDRFTGRAVQTKRTDLLSVGLSKIAPRCSEFIVEWSFGQTYPANSKANDPVTGKQVDFSNQIIWYGRTLPPKNPNLPYNPSDPYGVYHYQLNNPANPPAVKSNDPVPQFPDSALPQIDLAYKPFKGISDYAGISKVQDYIVPEWLVHGVYKWSGGHANANDPSSLVSYFGYVDPTYTQTDATEPPSIPWIWPKMIRVTMTLADAADPSIEQTFQYVFDLPPNPQP